MSETKTTPANAPTQLAAIDAMPLPWSWFESFGSGDWMDRDGARLDRGMIARMEAYAPDLVQAALAILALPEQFMPIELWREREQLADVVRRAVGPLVPSVCRSCASPRVTWNLSEVCDDCWASMAYHAIQEAKDAANGGEYMGDPDMTVAQYVRLHRDDEPTMAVA